jgi:quinohemoprotein amine dehydrogenase
MLAQFEAWAYHNGQDGKPGTPDDVRLDPVTARWTLEEYTATYEDDDVKFVGSIDEETGLFTPNIEGPNPERSGERNNVGDVWVVASYSDAGSKDPAYNVREMRARAHLLVTVPLYIRWEPWAAER